jgi:hypothetical protein
MVWNTRLCSSVVILQLLRLLWGLVMWENGLYMLEPYLPIIYQHDNDDG